MKKKQTIRIFISGISLILLLLIFFFLQQFLIPLVLYIICLIFMIKIGAHILFDFDPVPFSAFLVLYLYSPLNALYFLIIALPSIDMVSGRFSHFSFINFISALATILIFGFLFPKTLLLIYGILFFNLIRILITLFLGLGPQTVAFSLIHAFVFAVMGSVFSLFF